jgi:small subunit ribosomal protein S8
MTLVDPIADMLTRIRNAMMSLHNEVLIPKSKMKVAIAKILQQEGYIERFEEREREFTIYLKYVRGKAAIEGLKRVSRPGCRRYVGVGEIPKVQNGLGINILSTSQGVQDGNSARNNHLGGELLCQIW